jgi:MFS family permease
MATMLRDTLGLPKAHSRRPLVAAMLVDSLGSGLFLPFAIVYFVKTSTMSPATVGAGLSAAGLLALPVSPLVGPAVDRLGPKQVVLASNVLQAAGFIAYLWVGSIWLLIPFALIVNAGQNMFWTANGALVTLAADPGERARWFAMMRMLRNAGSGLGGLLAAVSVSIGSTAGYRALVVANAVSFLAAAAFLRGWTPAGSPVERPPARPVPDHVPEAAPRAAAPRGSYRLMLADRAFLALMLLNVMLVLCATALTVTLSVYLIRNLHQAAWLAGALFAFNTVIIVVAQSRITVATERCRPARVLQFASAVWAVAFLITWLATPMPDWLAVPALFLVVALWAIGQDIYSPSMNDFVASIAPAAERGRYFAALQLTWGIARTIAPAVFLGLLARGSQWLWITLLACSAILIVALPAAVMPLSGRAADSATTPEVSR